MTEYGKIANIKLYKNIWSTIIKYLPETDRYICKRINKSFYQIVKKLCIVGNIKELAENNLIESIILMGNRCNWNDGLEGACRGGHKEIADYMISKGANDWDWGLEGACLGNRKEMADYMILKGAN